jgi:hypothetical protein
MGSHDGRVGNYSSLNPLETPSLSGDTGDENGCPRACTASTKYLHRPMRLATRLTICENSPTPWITRATVVANREPPFAPAKKRQRRPARAAFSSRSVSRRIAVLSTPQRVSACWRGSVACARVFTHLLNRNNRQFRQGKPF